MKHREATPRDIKDFERIAADPKTAEVNSSALTLRGHREFF
jgi:hypothetical protein